MKLQIITLLIFTFYNFSILRADDYKVLYTNSNDVLVDGKKVQVGATFNDKSVITWAKGVERQAIKAVNTKTNKMCLFVSQSMEKNSLTAFEILTANKHLSTHTPYQEGQEISIPIKLRKSFEETYELLDTLVIDTNVKLPSSLSLIATYTYGDTRVSKTLKTTDGQIIIDHQLFNINGKALQPCDVTLNFDLYNKDEDMYTFIKADVQLLVVPEIAKQ
ncbi:MAG: hypothetical protein J5770_05935 [Bacteroidaceae bacterium]|nr:hypothetical protein [Bacteroidaceae bacterium]